jgi:uncharacterized membrane protein
MRDDAREPPTSDCQFAASVGTTRETNLAISGRLDRFPGRAAKLVRIRLLSSPGAAGWRSDRDLREPSVVSRAPSAFGEDAFGRRAEAAARFFGTPRYILGQTLVVIAWIAVNGVAVGLRWDPYPFILLNLAFSTQAAYAAPLILLAQTRQADRDKAAVDQLEAHRDEVMRHMQEREAAIKRETDELKSLLGSNTDLTREDKELTEKVEALTREIHARLQAQ